MKDSNIQFINQEFQSILNETIDKIEQDSSLSFWKTPFGKDFIFRNLQLACIHLRAISVLKENDDETLIISAVPITRAISESLFVLIYVFEDFKDRTCDFAKSLVREEKRAIRIFNERYLNKSDEWNKWIVDNPVKLEKIQKRLESEFSSLGITNFDWDNDKNRFPRLSKIKESFPETSSTRQFLNFLDDIYNRELSGFSHSESQAIAFLDAFLHKNGKAVRESFKAKTFGLSYVVVLSFLTEIEINLQYGLKEKLKDIWVNLTNIPETDIAKEFFEMRYQNLLND